MAAEHPLRTAAESLCRSVRRDRADGLYIARETIAQHPFFIQEPRGEFTVLHPSKAGAQAFSEWLGGDSTFGFERFSGRDLAQEDCFLLASGIKLLETACTSAQAVQFEKAVRQRAALLLRTHNDTDGGALEICMRIAAKIEQTAKGECK